MISALYAAERKKAHAWFIAHPRTRSVLSGLRPPRALRPIYEHAVMFTCFPDGTSESRLPWKRLEAGKELDQRLQVGSADDVRTFCPSDICLFLVAIRVGKLLERTKMWSASHEVIGNVSIFRISHSILFHFFEYLGLIGSGDTGMASTYLYFTRGTAVSDAEIHDLISCGDERSIGSRCLFWLRATSISSSSISCSSAIATS
jgi:hypothetical protein